MRRPVSVPSRKSRRLPAEFPLPPLAPDRVPRLDVFLRDYLARLEHEQSRLQRRGQRLDEQMAVVRQCLALLPGPGPEDGAAPLDAGAVPPGEPAVAAAAGAEAPVGLAWVRPPADDSPPPLRALLLGEFRLYRGGLEVRPECGAKVWRLIKFLVARDGGPVSRDVLIDTFWRRSRAGAAAQSLYSAMHAARRLLAGAEDWNYLSCDTGFYQLSPGVGLATDVAHLERLQAEARRARAAGEPRAALHALELAVEACGCGFLNDEPYESWAAEQREALASRHLETLALVAELHDENGSPLAAADCHRRLLALDPLREESHRALIELYARSGQRTAAVRQYRTFERALRRGLGIAPDPRTRAAIESALAQPPTSP